VFGRLDGTVVNTLLFLFGGGSVASFLLPKGEYMIVISSLLVRRCVSVFAELVQRHVGQGRGRVRT